jgi:hypothetical protein
MYANIYNCSTALFNCAGKVGRKLTQLAHGYEMDDTKDDMYMKPIDNGQGKQEEMKNEKMKNKKLERQVQGNE